ncbi:tetratricopeptide repeat protein [Streptomyces microflavus]|uniref:tetratricopeptide repeat protein n=1 Tax=Streptomyces microflavus TaxID=1919 RepID=UPI0036919783
MIDRTATRCAVWLDDLESYLGAGGLEPGLLAEFGRLRIPVLATMRHQQFEIFTNPGDTEGAGTEHTRSALTGARVLRQLDIVELGRLWSAGELQRAGEADDDRIADALTHHGPYGLAEYLAAGPALLQEWHRAARPGGHPRAAALIAAAVDLARTGLAPPYTLRLLTEAHEPYLTAAGGALLRPESFDTAMTWATRRRHGATSMLVPTQDPDAWGVFDYLTDHTDTPIPDTTWHTALQHTTNADELATIGIHAHEAAPGIAETSYRQAVEAGNANAMVNLGLLLHKAGCEQEAEGFYHQAVEAGNAIAMVNLALLLAEAGRGAEAEGFYRRAVEAGDTDAMFNLALLLKRTGRGEEAEVFYRRAVEAGNTDAMVNLGSLLAEAGRGQEAEGFYRRAVEAGDTDAMFNLGNLLAEAGRGQEAEGFYRRAVEAGDTDAMVNLGVLLRQMGGGEEAEVFYRRAVEAGDTDAMFNLGNLLAETGREREAEVFYQRAEEAGDSSAGRDQ